MNGKTNNNLRLAYVGEIPDFERLDTPVFDRTEDEDIMQIQAMAATLCRFLRSESASLDGVHISIENDPDEEEPYWRRTRDGYALRLCTEDGRLWCQVAFQLGYLLMHCLIDSVNPEKEGVSWAEELVCEATTFELMFELSENWQSTQFGEEDPNYVQAIRTYISKTTLEAGTSALSDCASREELIAINERNEYEDRIDESHRLFGLMEAEDLEALSQIRNYEEDTLLLRTGFWLITCDSAAVKYICELQENIPGCTVPVGVSQNVDLKNSTPTPWQIDIYCMMIRALRDLPREYAAFNFGDTDKTPKSVAPQIGFVQFARVDDDELLMEIGVDFKGTNKLYRFYSDDDTAIETFRQILDDGKLPDLNGWEDMTDKILFHKADAEKEIFPGITDVMLWDTVQRWRENMYADEYYSNAPSVRCKTYIALQFYNADSDDPMAINAMEQLKASFDRDDREYLNAHRQKRLN